MSNTLIKPTRLDVIAHGLFLTLYGVVKYIPPPLGDWLRKVIARPFFKKSGRIRIDEGVTFGYPYRISFGENVTLNEWVYLNAYAGIQIGDHVRIGHRATIITSKHRYDKRDIPIFKQGLDGAGVLIGDDVWIGCNSTILPGVRIGRGAIVGAGAVVTKDILDFEIHGGVPARKIGIRGAAEEDD